jgi:colicin import membrane protein
MTRKPSQKYFYTSLAFHLGIFLVLILGFDFAAPLPVFENTNKNDVISAVVLGDTAKSKIIPQTLTSPPAPQPKPKQPPPARTAVKQPPPLPAKKDVIALQKPDKKPIVKSQPLLKPDNIFGKDLLADIKKQNDKQKKLKQKALQANFQKALKLQAEQSLRQQLLNEEIKVQGTLSRQSQGIVDKYKALILQAISENWLVPPQADKKRSCELMIRVAPGGMVLDVQVTKSSGDPALDSSARAAVMKSSPLPVPSDSQAFDAFRQFILRVKPENITGNTVV